MNEAPKNFANLSSEEKRALLARLLREKAKASQAKDKAPLSHQQRALWFLYRLAPGSAAYNLLYTARIQFALDIPTLQRSLQTLVRRYSILTTTYTTQNGEPVQHFHVNQEVLAEIIDATTWSREALDQRLYEEGNRPFDLEKGPILRIQLFQRSTQEYILALTVHHIALDFWSLDILIDELYLLYAAERIGEKTPLAPPGPPFTEYVTWQSEMLKGSEGERLWSYWQEKLAGDLPMLSLPTDRPRPPVQTYGGASHSFPLSDELARQLRALANAEQATLYMIMLAAFQTLLYRYSQQEDILVGTPMLGRSRANLEKIVGYLVNPVVLRTDLSGNPTFKALLGRVRQTVVGALDHQDFPFPLLVERLQPKRDPSYSPLYQTLFIWDKPRSRNEDASTAGGQNLSLEPYLMGQQGAPFDITLTIFEVDGSLSADFRYNVDLFDSSTIARMEQHFVTLLASIVAQPEQTIRDLPLLTEKERQQILVEWNETQRAYPDAATIHQLIEAQVERTPDEEAIIFEGTSLSYRELNRRANLLARDLQEYGVGPDTLVGVSMERSVEMVIALLGILKAGGAYVPLDPAYPQERLAYMIEDSQVSVLLTQSAVQENLPAIDAIVFCLDAGWGAATTEQVANPVSAVGPDNLMYMIYTSGSTGKPKGVMNSHRGLANRLSWMQEEYGLTTADRVMQKTPFSFDVSVWEFFWPLMTGAGLVIARPGGQQDPAYLVSLIVEQQITTMHFVPSMLQAFLLEAGVERCTSLKRVICSGEALLVEHQERFFARLNAELHNLYGPTEAAIDVTYWACQRESNDPVVPMGRPIANTQIYILDEAMQPVPVGVPGELYIGGVNVARGYFNRPELTTEKFLRDPFNQQEGARLFKTGDLVRYRANGVIEFLGRIDFQVKIRGFRIELGEIEAALSQHPAIKDVVVVAREDTPGNKRLVAYLAPEQVVAAQRDVAPVQLSPQEVGLSIEELRIFLKDKLPYYMVPAAFLFLNTLPLLPNGKVNRKALPAPDMARPELEEAFIAPRTATEAKLAAIWTEVLGLDKVGVRDNYFDLGGASIQSLEIISKAGEAGLKLALETLFEFQTIEELAGAIEAGSPASTAQFPVPDEKAIAQATETPVQVASAPVPAQVIRADQGNTIIESLGVYLPPKVVTTDELLEHCAVPIRFPLARLSGIKSRRMAGETEFSIDLAKKAVADCLARSKYTPEDIDLLICGNISRCDRPDNQFSFEPSTSISLQRYFGFTNAIVFDVDNACTGLFTAINIIDAFLKAGLIRRGMAVSGEYITHLSRTAQKELEGFMDSRLACLTVGDAGTALILENTPDKRVGFHDFEMFSLGHYSRDCIGKATDREHGGAIMYTDAVRVSAVNMKYAVAHAANVIARSGWPHDAFQHIIIHQTSGTTIRDAAREINSYFGKEICTQENVINNIAERGNTATTTHMVAIMDSIRSNRIHAGDNAVFGITGSGATIGAALYTFDDLPDRMRRIDSGEYTPEKVKSEQRIVPLLPSTQRVRVESVGTIPAGSEVKKEAVALANAAARNCLAASSYKPNDIDLLLYSGVYRDEFLSEPAVAALIAGDLEINDAIESPRDKKTFALDVFNGALGFLNACHAAIGMMKANKGQNALIVTAEIENNREVVPTELLGIEETGSALLLDESPDGKTGFGNFVFKYFTDYIEALDAHSEVRNGKMTMCFSKDARLEEYYLQCVEETVRELLRIEQLEMSQIKVVLPPQISTKFIASLSNRMHVSQDKVVDVQSQHDLHTSSLPYALQHVREQQLARPGDIGLIISVGSGIQVGCATYYF